MPKVLSTAFAFGIFALLPAGQLLWAADSGRPNAAQPAVAVQAPVPGAAALQPLSALDNREIRAQLMPRRYTTIAAEIGAKVRALPVPEGASFRQGTTLVSFDCTLQQAQVNKAQASLGAAEQTWRANQRLNELQSVGKVELELSEAEVTKAKAELASNAAVLSKCEITAPFSGRVAEQRIREQQYAQQGQVLLEILDDSALEIEFIVPSKWMVWLKSGYKFQIQIDETGKRYPARVQRMGARVDPVSQSIKVSASIDGHFSELIAGMSGQVNLTPPPGR